MKETTINVLQQNEIALIYIAGTPDSTECNIDALWKASSEFKYMRLKYNAVNSMKNNAKRGFHNGGRMSFGYRPASGSGGKKIARFLNEQNQPEGFSWKPSSILSILNNQSYLGHVVWNKKPGLDLKSQCVVTKDCHPAIIDEATWKTSQELLPSRRIKR